MRVHFPAVLFLRLIVFTVLMPGYIAGYLPYTLGPRHLRPNAPILTLAGCLLIILGALTYALCASSFFLANGTPAIFFTRPLRHLLGEEPSHLVRSGLYRYSRNPMYIGVLTIIFGQALLFASRSIAFYGAFIFLCFHCVVVFVEEPHLRARDPEAFAAFVRTTPRWLGPHKP